MTKLHIVELRYHPLCYCSQFFCLSWIFLLFSRVYFSVASCCLGRSCLVLSNEMQAIFSTYSVFFFYLLMNI